MSRTSANILLLMAGTIWGMGFVAQQTAMEDIGPMLFIAMRFILAGLAVAPFAYAEMKRKKITSMSAEINRFKGSFFLVGLAFFLAMAFQQVGLIGTSVTNAGFLTALYVIMVPIIMISVLRVAQPVVIWPASILALGGIYLLSGGDLASLNSGDMLIILCSFFWAAHVILTGRVGQKTDLPVTMATIQFFVTAVLAFICFAIASTFGLGESIPSSAQLLGALPEILYAGFLLVVLALHCRRLANATPQKAPQRF